MGYSCAMGTLLSFSLQRCVLPYFVRILHLVVSTTNIRCICTIS